MQLELELLLLVPLLWPAMQQLWSRRQSSTSWLEAGGAPMQLELLLLLLVPLLWPAMHQLWTSRHQSLTCNNTNT